MRPAEIGAMPYSRCQPLPVASVTVATEAAPTWDWRGERICLRCWLKLWDPRVAGAVVVDQEGNRLRVDTIWTGTDPAGPLERGEEPCIFSTVVFDEATEDMAPDWPEVRARYEPEARRAHASVVHKVLAHLGPTAVSLPDAVEPASLFEPAHS